MSSADWRYLLGSTGGRHVHSGHGSCRPRLLLKWFSPLGSVAVSDTERDPPDPSLFGRRDSAYCMEGFILAPTMPTTRKNTTRNRASRKRTAKKAVRAKTGSTGTLARLQGEIPPTLRAFTRRMGRGLSKLEKRIEQEGRVARRKGTRMLRHASHRLGQLEAQGEREWRKQSSRARHAAVRLLRQLERSLEPPRSSRRRKTTARRSRGSMAGRAS
jgi:hypothetical protein